MIYFITSDIHSFYDEFIRELKNSGFDENNKEHTLIICGDLFDRGMQAKELLDYLLKLDRLILIKGNHEDLLLECLEQLEHRENINILHKLNGTLNTIAQLTNINEYDLLCGIYNYEEIKHKLEDYFKLINKAKDYVEIGNYIFVHGWIPHIKNYEDLSKCSEEQWKNARWYNGMKEWHNGWKFNNKTIVCGHWHCSYGNYYYHNKGEKEIGDNADYSPFIDKGIIAVDCCTAYTHKVNIVKMQIDI